MKAKPWSFSSLSTFVQCPYKYMRLNVAKDIKEKPSAEMEKGTRDHAAFEAYVKNGIALPAHLESDKPFIDRMNANLGPGERIETERKVALNSQFRPTEFFADDVWWRGVIDWTRYTPLIIPGKPDRLKARVVDYKTGKYKGDTRQNKLFSLYLFAEGIDLVDSRYYWTQTKQEVPRLVLDRTERRKIWTEFLPDLTQYYQAFTNDTWQKRPSGLCKGWCPVKDCPHWRERK